MPLSLRVLLTDDPRRVRHSFAGVIRELRLAMNETFHLSHHTARLRRVVSSTLPCSATVNIKRRASTPR